MTVRCIHGLPLEKPCSLCRMEADPLTVDNDAVDSRRYPTAGGDADFPLSRLERYAGWLPLLCLLGALLIAWWVRNA